MHEDANHWTKIIQDTIADSEGVREGLHDDDAIPLVEWGEKSNQLSDSFHVGHEMLEKRARMRAMLLQAIVPPLLFLFLGAVLLFLVVALFAPMIDLISKLS